MREREQPGRPLYPPAPEGQVCSGSSSDHVAPASCSPSSHILPVSPAHAPASPPLAGFSATPMLCHCSLHSSPLSKTLKMASVFLDAPSAEGHFSSASLCTS